MEGAKSPMGDGETWDPAGGPQDVGHACVATIRRGFSMPSFFQEAQGHAPWKAKYLEWKSTFIFNRTLQKYFFII